MKYKNTQLHKYKVLFCDVKIRDYREYKSDRTEFENLRTRRGRF